MNRVGDREGGGDWGVGDRLLGALTLALAIVIGLESLTFTTSFPTDPLGPKAFPLVSAALLALGGAWVAARPGRERVQRLPRVVWLGAASFVVYALLLQPVGFFLATLLEMVVLSTLFGGRPFRSAVAGAVFVGALYLLFAIGLGLPLPLGSLFVIGD